MPSKGTNTERGYGWAHQRRRKAWVPKVATGRVKCWRCGEPIAIGQDWDLGHDDYDRRRYRGPEHARAKDCAAGGNRSTRSRQAPPTDTTRAW